MSKSYHPAPATCRIKRKQKLRRVADSSVFSSCSTLAQNMSASTPGCGHRPSVILLGQAEPCLSVYSRGDADIALRRIGDVKDSSPTSKSMRTLESQQPQGTTAPLRVRRSQGGLSPGMERISYGDMLKTQACLGTGRGRGAKGGLRWQWIRLLIRL